MQLLAVLVLCATQALGARAAVRGGAPAQVLSYNMETANMPNSYNFHYEASDGSSRREEGGIVDAGTDQAALSVLGTVRWYDEKGNLYEMSYKAGKRGYRTIIRQIN